MIVVKTVYELEPRISSCIVKKTGCQASRSGSEPTKSVDSVADRNRVRAPRGRRGWPHVAGVLPSAAVTSQSAALTPPAPSRSIPRLSSNFCSFLAATTAELGPHLRRRHSQLQPALSRPFATTTASTSSQQLPASPIARCSSLVSHRNAQRLAGAPPLAPSPWPRRLRPPLAVIACDIG